MDLNHKLACLHLKMNHRIVFSDEEREVREGKLWIAKKHKRRAKRFYVIKLIGVNVESDRLALTWNSGFSH